MTPIVTFFAGMLLVIFGFFCWYMLTMIKKLTAAVDLQVKATHELLGEGSFTRISKSLAALNSAMPDIVGGMTEFSKTMKLVFRAAQEPEEATRVPGKNFPPSDLNSGFYHGVTDQEAAVQEVQAEAERQKLYIRPEDLAQMHTDEAT
jgi:hypothetical protein